MFFDVLLSLGVIIFALVVALVVDSYWAMVAWTLTGSAMVWGGGQLDRSWARLVGVLLLIGAALIFGYWVWYPPGAGFLVNSYYIGAVLLAAASLSASYCLQHHVNELKWWDQWLGKLLLVWGLVCWYIGGIREVIHHVALFDLIHALLMLCCASVIVMGMVSRRFDWPQLAVSLLSLLPCMIVSAPLVLTTLGPDSHFLTGGGMIVWPVAFFIQYRLLSHFGRLWPKGVTLSWHAATMWLGIFILTYEAAGWVRHLPGLGDTWQFTCWALVPAVMVLLLSVLVRMLRWPVARFFNEILHLGCSIPVAWLLLWFVASLFVDGNPAPLSYIPFLNPLELTQVLVWLVIFHWVVTRQSRVNSAGSTRLRQICLWGLGFLVFVWLNSVIIRIGHYFQGIPFNAVIYDSRQVQIYLVVLWALMAFFLFLQKKKQDKV